MDDAVGSFLGWRKVKTRTGAGSARLVDDLQVLDASRSYVPGSLWAGLANGRGNFTDGAGVLCFCFVRACYQQSTPHWVVSVAVQERFLRWTWWQNIHLSLYLPNVTCNLRVC